MSVRIVFEPKDLWVGIYNHGFYLDGGTGRRRVYICLIPMLPLVIDWQVSPLGAYNPQESSR